MHNYNFSNPKTPRNASFQYGMTGHFTQGEWIQVLRSSRSHVLCSAWPGCGRRMLR